MFVMVNFYNWDNDARGYSFKSIIGSRNIDNLEKNYIISTNDRIAEWTITFKDKPQMLIGLITAEGFYIYNGVLFNQISSKAGDLDPYDFAEYLTLVQKSMLYLDDVIPKKYLTDDKEEADIIFDFNTTQDTWDSLFLEEEEK